MNNLPGMFSMGGSLLQGWGAMSAGNYNRDAAYAAARDAEMTGVAQEEVVRNRGRKAIGEQAAALAGNGFSGNSGTALDLLHESQVNAVLDVLEVRRQATSRATNLRTTGDMAAYQGKQSAVASLLGGAANLAAQRSDWAAVRAPYSSGGY